MNIKYVTHKYSRSKYNVYVWSVWRFVLTVAMNRTWMRWIMSRYLHKLYFLYSNVLFKLFYQCEFRKDLKSGSHHIFLVVFFLRINIGDVRISGYLCSLDVCAYLFIESFIVTPLPMMRKDELSFLKNYGDHLIFIKRDRSRRWNQNHKKLLINSFYAVFSRP